MTTLEQHLHALAVIGSIDLATFNKCLKELDFIKKEIVDLSEEEKKIVTDIILSVKL